MKTLPTTSTPMGRNSQLKGLISDCLAKGIVQGDVDPTVSHDEVIDLLMAAYVWVYRLAAWHDADAAEMTAVMDRQIEVIASGFAKR